MANIIVGCAKYMMVILIIVYAYHCFIVFNYEDKKQKLRVFRYQNVLMFMIHFMAFSGMYFKTGENKITGARVSGSFYKFCSSPGPVL